MDEFTNEEKDRISKLYGNDFAGITPDDASLIARWEAYKAKTEAETDEAIVIMRTECDARMEQSRLEHEEAMNMLAELKDAALARLEAIENV